MANIEGYTLVRNDRIRRIGGGVALYIRNTLNFNVLARSHNIPVFFNAEYIFYELLPSNQNKIFVAVIYRPPKAPFFKGINFLNVIASAFKDYSSKVILGDFNSNMLTLNPYSNIMCDFILDNSLKLIPHGITHTKLDSQTHIDLCLTDSNDTILSYHKSDGPFIGYHYLIGVTLKFFIPVQLVQNFH